MRVISGIARGKKLVSPTTEATQPTMDRAKETLFNMLESWRLKEGKGWGQMSFLDVFAGSGSIGIEAWSRGVKCPYFMENNEDALKVLNQNLNLMKLPPATPVDALNPPLAPRAMSIVFMDAPYGRGLWQAALPAFDAAGWIDNQTLIIIETDKKLKESLPAEYILIQERSAGRNTFLFAKQNKES